MKVLDNPWVVGGLCLIAAGVVGYQFLPPRPRGTPAPNGSAAPAPAAAPAARPAGPGQAVAGTAPGANVNLPATLIDLSYVQSRLPQWLESPPRDPFRLSPAANPATAPVSPLSHWKLKAIWRQTGSQLAAINKRIYAVGDVIEGYRIEQIEIDRVWFQGPTGRESLGFAKPQPPSPAK